MERALAQKRDPHGAPIGPRPIRLMIVDDSVVARAVLSRMIESDGGFEIAAVAASAEDAIDSLQAVKVDTVVLDLEMPGAGGLRSIPRILEVADGARVMIVSSLAEDGAEETMAALALGATDALPKPGASRFNGRFSQILLARLKALGYADRQQPSAAALTDLQPVKWSLRAMPHEPIQLLAVGASTGGIHALSMLFQSLPRKIGAPVLVTQHLPSLFMPVFARQLAVAAQRETLVAEDGMRLLPDRIILAPGDAHISLVSDLSGPVVKLVRDPVPSGCMPSLDPMFEAAGSMFGSAALGVVLTGMGRDGVRGAARLVGSGGAVIAQDEATCAVWGMPRAVAEAGLCSAVIPPEKIARRIASRVREELCR